MNLIYRTLDNTVEPTSFDTKTLFMTQWYKSQDSRATVIQTADAFYTVPFGNGMLEPDTTPGPWTAGQRTFEIVARDFNIPLEQVLGSCYMRIDPLENIFYTIPLIRTMKPVPNEDMLIALVEREFHLKYQLPNPSTPGIKKNNGTGTEDNPGTAIPT